MRDEGIELKAYTFAMKQALTDEGLRGLHRVTIERTRDVMLGGFVYAMRAEVYGQQLEDVTIRYPAGWWQAFKERWAPRWALKRWPVRYREHHIEIAALLPDLPLELGPAKLHKFERITEGP